MFKWKKANGKYDEEKQFEAFSKTIQSEFKKDPEMKNMKDLEMIVAFFDDAYGALQWGDCKGLEPRIPDRKRRKYIRYNKDEGEDGNKDTES
ncbi:hypothetical protein Tco_0471147 [Tanacetum coccineum]